MQIEQRATEWLRDELQRGEKLCAVAAGSYPSLVRGKSVWVVAGGAAIVGVGVESVSGVPSPLGLVGAFLAALALWYGWLLRRPPVAEQPAAPWPLVVATTERVIFIERALVGGGGAIRLERSRRDLERLDVASRSRNAMRTTLAFRNGPTVDVELRDAGPLVAELGASGI